MNEQDWFTWWDAFDLLSWCEDDECKLNQRKLRLFAAACCRTIWPLLTEDLTRRAVKAAEWVADHERDREVLLAVRREAEEALRVAEPAAHEPAAATRESVLAFHLANLAELLTREDFIYKHMAQDVADMVTGLAMLTPIPPQLWGTADGDAIAEKAAGERGEIDRGLVREIFCNPLRPLSAHPSWLRWNGGAVASMAQTIYDDRAFERMPILADALEDAGCTEAAIIDHCRGPGPHVRGCWVVDLLLQKQ
jgi:hypothetical protein